MKLDHPKADSPSIFPVSKPLAGILFDFSPVAGEIWYKRLPGTCLKDFTGRPQNYFLCLYMAKMNSVAKHYVLDIRLNENKHIELKYFI